MHRNYKRTAAVASLEYVSDSNPGISREKEGTSFTYFFNGSAIKEEEILIRIKKLVIPPAWTKVWICPNPNGHIQVTGYDIKNRKQYKYHPSWNAIRNQTKFHRLY